MTLSPILKVLSIFSKCEVKSLLIGGQACIIYGAAEFSRDSDFVVLCEAANLSRLKKALKLLKATAIYVPPLEKEYLEKGHACHFRCFAKGVERLRVDIMAKMRGCGPFEDMWARRKSVKLAGNGVVEVISLEDLVASKKTQCDKDWLMLKRLVANDIYMVKSLRQINLNGRFLNAAARRIWSPWRGSGKKRLFRFSPNVRSLRRH